MSEHHQESLFSLLRNGPLRVCVLGSGNWGTACSKLIASNAAESYIFHTTVKLWVREERVNETEWLHDVINRDHVNPKYLPGVALPPNIVAVSSLAEAVKDADLIAFILPHQFMATVCKQLADTGCVKPTARAITLVKGLHLVDNIPYTFSRLVENWLKIECSALSGANVAKDVANEQFCETTIGYKEQEMASIWQQLFDRPTFRVHALPDPEGLQACGAIKNLIALAAGFCDGLNMGSNTKAAIIRLGVSEMKLFATVFFQNVLEETFFDSCGFADVITTCYGGRNVRCAAEFVRAKGAKSWEQIEAELLGGQKMQGQLTCQEVFTTLKHFKIESHFPLFQVTHRVAFEGAPATELLEVFMRAQVSEIKLQKECSYSVLYGPLKAVQSKVNSVVENTTTPFL